MDRLSFLMIATAALWLLAPVAAGLAGGRWGAIAPLALAMLAVQVAGKPHLLRPPQPAALATLALGALLFAALGLAAGRGLATLIGPMGRPPAPWIMLGLSGLASWRIRGLSDPAMQGLLDEATDDLERAARDPGRGG